MAKAAAPKPPTKTEIFARIAEATSLTKKDVDAVFRALTDEIAKELSTSGSGQFTLPGLAKILVQHQDAKPKRKVRNPGTGEMQWADPKPASRKVKVRPLKALKDMA
ncbi:HU family DNA-binding protein [Lignipirellula cremea]|nr:HU family DNA-binding protein [Lignipirellula cremea]